MIGRVVRKRRVPTSRQGTIIPVVLGYYLFSFKVVDSPIRNPRVGGIMPTMKKHSFEEENEEEEEDLSFGFLIVVHFYRP